MSAKELKYNFPFLILDSIRNDCSFARLETEFLFYRKMAHYFGKWNSTLKRVCKKCKKNFRTNRSDQKICKDCKEMRMSSESIKRREYQERYRARKTSPENLKLFNVFERDNFRCAYCGKTSYEDNVKLIVEHIFPRSKGGTNEGHNIITACSDCNNRKRDKIMDWNVILTLWQIVDKRNKEKDIDWNSLKQVFDKQYKIKRI